MSHRESLIRSDRALALRAQGHTFEEVAELLGFASRGSAKHAVEAAIARSSEEWTPARSRATLLAAAQESVRVWSERFQQAYEAKDVDGMAAAHAALLDVRKEEAKLTGAYAPATVAVDIGSDEFARKALELLEVVGLEPLAELAGHRMPALDAEVIDDDTEPWANIGTTAAWGYDRDEADPPPSSMPLTPPHTPQETATALCGPLTPAAAEDTPTSQPDPPEPPELPPGVVPLIPGHRRVPAREMLTATGVPLDRALRRSLTLDARPARTVGRVDPMPARALPERG